MTNENICIRYILQVEDEGLNAEEPVLEEDIPPEPEPEPEIGIHTYTVSKSTLTIMLHIHTRRVRILMLHSSDKEGGDSHAHQT